MDERDEILLLKQRASKLGSNLPKSSAQDENKWELVEFILADEHYAIESRFIREVYPLKDITPLPCVPNYVAGIVNIRRKIISVLDLKRIFDLPANQNADDSKILILEKGDMGFGIIADSIIGVSLCSKDIVQNALPTMTGIRQDLLKGITPDRLIILDGEKLLTDKSLLVNETVT